MTEALPLRVRGPGGGPPVLLSDLTTASTVEDLECGCRIALQLPETTALVLLVGFPPRPLTEEGGTVLAGLLRPNEVVTVREEDGHEATVLQGTGAMKQKRGGGGGGKKKKAATTSSSPTLVNAGPQIRTLHQGSGGGGGGGVGGRCSSSSTGGGGAARKRRRVDVGMSSEEDIGSLLVAAVTKGGGGGRVGQCMRAVFRKAMEKQFDESKANARVAAADAGRYVIEESQAARRADGGCARLKVTYHKGLGFQSNFEDDVELLPKAQLTASLASVLDDADAREMLKPACMAGCSPRVFWSLLYHYGGGGVEAALRQLLPGRDWGFLHERHRKLSEKALANQAQEEELRLEREDAAREAREARQARLLAKQNKKKETVGEGGGGGEGGSAVAVALTEGGEEDAVDEREVWAQAALARLQPAGGGGGQGAHDEKEEVDSDYPEAVSDAWVKVLTAAPFSLPTCAALAAADAEELAPRLQQHHAAGATPLAPSAPTEDEVQAWISAAQSDEMDTVMMEIVGQDEDLLEALECVHVATPKDVKLWASVPTALLDMLERDLSEEKWGVVAEKLPSVEAVQALGRKAEGYQDKLAWLELWGSD